MGDGRTASHIGCAAGVPVQRTGRNRVPEKRGVAGARRLGLESASIVRLRLLFNVEVPWEATVDGYMYAYYGKSAKPTTLPHVDVHLTQRHTERETYILSLNVAMPCVLAKLYQHKSTVLSSVVNVKCRR